MPFIKPLFSGGDNNPLASAFFWSSLDPITEGSVPWDDQYLNGTDYPMTVAYDPNSTGFEWDISNNLSKHHGVSVAAPLWQTFVNNVRMELQSSDAAYNTPAKIGAALMPNNQVSGFVIRAQLAEATSATNQYSIACLGDTATGGACLVRRVSGSGNNLAVIIDTTTGTETLNFAATITDCEDHLFAVKIDPVAGEVSLRVDGGSFETLTTTGDINAGVYTLGIGHRRHAAAYTDGFYGSVSQIGWFVDGFLSEADLDTLWNSGYGATVTAGTPKAISITDAGTFNYTKMSAGAGATGKSDFFYSNSAVGGSRLRLVFQLNVPYLNVSGPQGNILYRSTAAQQFQIQRDGTTNLKAVIFNGTARTASISPGFPFGFGRLMDDNWITFMLSWDASTDANDFFIWYTANGFAGWRKVVGSGNNNASLTFLQTSSACAIGGWGTANSHEVQLRHVIMTNQNLDFNDVAVRNSLFINGGVFPKALDTSGWSELGGVQPWIYSPDGDLAGNNLGTLTFTNAGTTPTTVTPTSPFAPLTQVP